MITLALSMLLAGQTATPVNTVLAADQKVKCRTEEVTGSLAGRTRRCHTVAEWRVMDEAGNTSANDIIQRGERTCGDCKPGG